MRHKLDEKNFRIQDEVKIQGETFEIRYYNVSKLLEAFSDKADGADNFKNLLNAEISKDMLFPENVSKDNLVYFPPSLLMYSAKNGNKEMVDAILDNLSEKNLEILLRYTSGTLQGNNKESIFSIISSKEFLKQKESMHILNKIVEKTEMLNEEKTQSRDKIKIPGKVSKLYKNQGEKDLKQNLKNIALNLKDKVKVELKGVLTRGKQGNKGKGPSKSRG